VLSIISRFSTPFQQLLKLLINTKYLEKKDMQVRKIQKFSPKFSTCKTLDVIRPHVAVVSNSRCTERPHKKILKVPTKTLARIKLFFQIPGLSRKPRILLKC